MQNIDGLLAQRSGHPFLDPSGAAIVFDGRLDNRDELVAMFDPRLGASIDAPDSPLVLAAYAAFALAIKPLRRSTRSRVTCLVLTSTISAKYCAVIASTCPAVNKECLARGARAGHREGDPRACEPRADGDHVAALAAVHTPCRENSIRVSSVCPVFSRVGSDSLDTIPVRGSADREHDAGMESALVRRQQPGGCAPTVLMDVLGISCYFHDAGAALLRDGLLVAAAEEERFSRVKHDPSFPTRAIRFCLEKGGTTGSDIDYVAFFEKPFVKLERILQTALATAPWSSAVFRKAATTWLLDKLWVKTHMREALGIPGDRILFAEHHQSHAASAFYCSPFEESAILTLDGVGEWTTTAVGYGSGSECRLSDEIRFPHSLGLLYSAFTAFLGFEVNDGEYKVMGLAPYGTPRFIDDVRRVVRQAADGSFALDLDYFSFHHSATRTFNRKFEQLFGRPRQPEASFFTSTSDYPSYYGPKPGNFHELARENQRYADIAASIQVVTEELILGLARQAHRRTGSTRLCMAGGVALNSVANGRVLRETPFTDLYIQPAAGDGGAAVGAALHVYHSVLGQPRRFVMDHAYWGESHDAAAINNAVSSTGLPFIQFDDEDALLDRTVDLLVHGQVVGWLQGAFEWGPRALGNRSILADPRRADMKDIINTKIKFREPYRPFAPAVLAERASEFFGLDQPARHMPARFMLLVAPVREGAREQIPAVTHVDGSARLQTVFADTNPRYHALIERFGAASGVPVVLNTSLNLRGEPIVNTPAEALQTFGNSGMDALVLDRTMIFKQNRS